MSKIVVVLGIQFAALLFGLVGVSNADGPSSVVGDLRWPEQWVVFGPLQREHPVLPVDILKTIPQSIEVGPILGADAAVEAVGRKLTAQTISPTDNQYDFAKIFAGGEIGTTGYAFLLLKADKAGEVTIGMGADWWMQAWLNGKPVLDTYESGNVVNPYSITNYTVKVRLQVGRNVLAVRFSRGAGSAVLAIGGPNELRAIPAAGWTSAPVVKAQTGAEVVPNGGFEDSGAGDPPVPAGWHNGEGSFGFAAGELIARKNNPISGGNSLEINTLSGGPGKKVLYVRLKLVPCRMHKISYKARRIAGGNVTVMLRESPYGGVTYFLEHGRIGPGGA